MYYSNLSNQHYLCFGDLCRAAENFASSSAAASDPGEFDPEGWKNWEDAYYEAQDAFVLDASRSGPPGIVAGGPDQNALDPLETAVSHGSFSLSPALRR